MSLTAAVRPFAALFSLALLAPATALAQGLVTAYIAIAGHGYTFVLAGFFIALWLSAAHLFLRAEEDAVMASAGN